MDRRRFLAHSAMAATGLAAFPLVGAKGVAADVDVTIRLHPDRKLRRIAQILSAWDMKSSIGRGAGPALGR